MADLYSVAICVIPLMCKDGPSIDGIQVVIMHSFKYFAYSASGKMPDLYDVAILFIPPPIPPLPPVENTSVTNQIRKYI